MQQPKIQVKVQGDYACFSRPEFKVERVSYQVMTPGAARGILEAIFWKPEFRYQIREIHVLKLGTQTTILRNELSSRQGASPILIEDKGRRQQRNSLILKDVAYLIKADMVLRSHTKNDIKAYIEQFERRLQKGQCHHTPYLGTREFAAYFEPPQNNESADQTLNLDLGTMLFDIAFVEDENRQEMEFKKPLRDGTGQRTAKGYAVAVFFDAKLVNGILSVPSKKYDELYELEDNHA